MRTTSVTRRPSVHVVDRQHSSAPLLLAASAGLTLTAVAFLPRRAEGQGVTTPPPQIVVSARGDVQVSPDRAHVMLGVETQALTAAAAASENSAKQAAVIAAIRALGVPAANITTTRFSVEPVQRYDDKQRRVLIDGYRVSNIVEVQTDRLEQTGAILDAALGKGANRVVGLDFRLKNADGARDEALSKAVASAKRQAEVAAAAAGGAVAELLELSVQQFDRPDPRPMMAMRADMAMEAAAPTPVSEGTMTVSVSVMTRWRFTASR